MHVFFITQWFPTAQQPISGFFVLEHARGVSQIHQVSLLHIQGVDKTLKQPALITIEEDRKGLMIYHLSYQRSVIPYTTWIRQWIAAKHVFDQVERQFGRIDIIHANVNNTAMLAVLLGRLAGIPVVISEYSSAYGRKLFTPRQALLVRYFMNQTDLIMPDSDSLKEYMRDFGVTKPMIRVHNVVDTELFYPAVHGERVVSPHREIIIVARLSEEKAVHLAIEAVGRLQKRNMYIFLHIVGDGPEKTRLEALVKRLGLTEWVQFHGYLTKLEIAKLLRRASAFVLTSLWESKPSVVLEALMCGIPVVAPAVGGIPEVVPQECGQLFEPGNLDDLTDRLLGLLSNFDAYDNELIHQYAIDNFSAMAVNKILDHIYGELIKDRHAFSSVSEA